MKRLILFSIAFLLLVVATHALAQDSSKSSPTQEASTSSVSQEKVQELKEKLATKVAQLRVSQTRGFFGEIAAISKTSFTLVTKTGEVKVRFSEDALVYKMGDKKVEGSLADLKNMLTAAVLGVYDEESKLQTAKIIFITTKLRYFRGEAADINKTDAVIKIKTAKGNPLVFDYEKTTTTGEYDKTDGTIKKSGLSRLATGDILEIWGTPSEDDNQKIKAAKILRIPRDLFTTAEVTSSPEASTTATPKASAKPTPKASPKPTPEASPEG